MRVIRGRVTDAGGGMVTITVARDTMTYPKNGVLVAMVVDEEEHPNCDCASCEFDRKPPAHHRHVHTSAAGQVYDSRPV